MILVVLGFDEWDIKRKVSSPSQFVLLVPWRESSVNDKMTNINTHISEMLL